MTSESNKEAFVWIWLPGEAHPVVAGRLSIGTGRNTQVTFNYGRSYLERLNENKTVMPVYEPELPLKEGIIYPRDGLTMPGCIRDAAPDAWGRRVIINKLLGQKGSQSDTNDLDELTYLLESGSDRIGALDFQRSPDNYIPRTVRNASLEELLESAEKVEKGIPLNPELDLALFHGSSIGGARPKALIQDGDKKYIAKFSSPADLYSVVKAEFVAMRLASLAGLDVAPVKLVRAANKDVLLIERFDRQRLTNAWSRRAMVSALTILELDDMTARYASYEKFAEIIRHRFTEPKQTLKELFTRLLFNVLCGNTDDHARNHAAFWDGEALSLTAAYDICPQGRTGNEASQAMLISGNNNLSQLSVCLSSAKNYFLSEPEGKLIAEKLIAAIKDNWTAVCDEAQLSQIDRSLLMGRQFLNPFSLM